MATTQTMPTIPLTPDELAPRVTHPVYGRNWHGGSSIEPAGLLFDDERYGDIPSLTWTLDRDTYDAVGEAAPGEGLTFDGFLNVALHDYLAEVLGTDFSGLYEGAAQAYLAKIGKPVKPRRTGKRPRTPRGR